MTALHIALSEFKRMTSGFLPKLAILALSLVPLLYGAGYLYANWDPQANLHNLHAALVVDDQGATDANGKHRDIGADVANSLHESGTFTWIDVSSKEDAEKGVESGEYAFALHIPAGFSQALLSVNNVTPGRDNLPIEQGRLEVVTNDANNAMVTSFVDTLTTEIHTTVAKQVGTQAADEFLTSFGVIHQNILKAADGADQLADGARQLDQGVGQLQTGAKQLAGGAKQLNTGAQQLRTGVHQLSQGASQLHQGTTQMVAGQDQLHQGASQLHEGTTSMVAGQRQLSAGATRLHTGTSQLDAGLSQMDQQTSTLVSDTQKLAEGSEQVAQGNEQLNTQVQQAIALVRQAPAEARSRLITTNDQLVADQVITREQADKILARFDSLQQTQAHQDIVKKLDQASSDMQRLADGSRQVADGNRRLANATPALRKGIVDAHQGASQLDDGARQLDDGLKTSLAGAQQLDSGAKQLEDGLATSAAGARQLDDGAKQLDDGLVQAASGADDLAKGTSQLVDGTKKAQDGANALRKGSSQLLDGSQQLAKGLHDGADQIPNVGDARKKKASETIGDPVIITNTSQAKAGSYGASLAPFFLSLALWVGVFILVQVLRPMSRRALASHARSWSIALGGWLPFFGVSVLQATLLLLVAHFSLGLDPSSLPLTLLFMLLVTMAYTAVIQGTVALLGAPGKFIILVLLVLQLIGSGGTIPWQMTPEPLHFVHTLLPMAHAVDGMRRLIYGSNISAVTSDVVWLVGYALLGLFLAVLAVHRHRMWTLTTLHPELEV